MDIDVVIIGINCQNTLKMCINSVLQTNYSLGKINIIYSDGGSTDNSLQIAREYENVKVIELNLQHPTPGRQRNEGWLAGNSEYVQFIDSDTILNNEWIATAIAEIKKSNIDAVCGIREEIYPLKTIFNWLGNLEWNPSYGKVDAFGGDVMLTRKALKKTGGYNPNLVAGEDPELSYRIRQIGMEIIRLNKPMTLHDLAMKKISQYLKRGYRTGYAYAEVNNMHKKMWTQDVRRIFIRGGAIFVAMLSIVAALFNPIWLLLAVLMFLIAIRPRLLLVDWFKKNMNLDKNEAKIYAWHASIVVLPQFAGICRYYGGKIFKKPLKNKAKKLKTGGIDG